MSYRPFETLVAPARASASLGRLALGTALVVVGYMGFVILVLNTLNGSAGPDGLDWLIAARTPAAVVVQLGLFVGLIGSVTAALVIVHNRSLASLIGPLRHAWRQGLRVALVLTLLNALLFLLPLPAALTPQPNLPLATWLAWLPLALPALVVQTGAEELAFRGYLQSQLAARFDHPLVWIALPSALFAALHYDAELMGPNALPVAIWAGAFGLAAADLTARSGTLGPAIAFHFVNNAVAILGMAPRGPLDGLARTTYPLSYDDPLILTMVLPLDLMMILCSWLAARLALRV